MSNNSEEIVTTQIRAPKRVLDQLTEVAARNDRSRNSEMVRRLEQSLHSDQQPKEAANA